MVNNPGTISEPVNTVVKKPEVRYSEGQRIIRIFFGRKLAVIGLVLIVLLILTAIFSPWLAPHDPYKVNYGNKLAAPSWQHIFGTDVLGRDILSRIIYGSRTSLVVGIGAIGMATVIGGFLGLVAAYFGGIVFNVIMRCIDTLMAIPMMLIALIIASVLGGGVKNIIIALGIGMISQYCRMMCGQALTVKQNDYILAGRSLGMSDMRMMFMHILPNAFPPIFVMITIGLGIIFWRKPASAS